MTRRLLPLLSLLALALVLASPRARADCEGLPIQPSDRPGNDDIFIFVDTSLSMGPPSFGGWAHGYMEPVRELLGDIASCYVKQGDFVLIAGFDSEARVLVAKPIAEKKRDLSALQEQIRDIDIGRARYWRRTGGADGRGAETATGRRDTHVTGGALQTDLGVLLEEMHHVLESYSSPKHRQLVLLFTDGVHDPPSYSAYSGQDIGIESFFPGLDVQRYKLGIVALPDEDGNISSEVQDLAEKIDPTGERRADGQLGVMEPDPADPASSLIEQIVAILQMRIDLVSPQVIDLGTEVSPSLKQSFRVRNRTKRERVVELVGAQFVRDDGARVVLEIDTQQLTLPAEGEASFQVAGELGSMPAGPFGGIVEFEFASATAFNPTEVPLKGVQVSWLQAYWWVLVLVAVLLAVGAGVGIYLRRKAVWVVVLWSKDGRSSVSRVRSIAIKQTLKFGAAQYGSRLGIEGPETPLGEVTRESVGDYTLAWDYRWLSTDLSSFKKGDPMEMKVGLPYDVPNHTGESVTVHITYTRSAMDSLVKQFGGGGGAGGAGIPPAASGGSIFDESTPGGGGGGPAVDPFASTGGVSPSAGVSAGASSEPSSEDPF